MTISLSPRVRGRSPAQTAVAVVGPLTDDDLAMLADARGTKPEPLKALRDSHHRLARCLASGMTPGQAAAQTGYSQSRVSILQADPAFADLIAVYRKAGAAEFADFTDLALGNMVKAERLIEDTLEHLGEQDNPLELSQLKSLQDLISDRADRFGYPKTSNHNVTSDLGGRLEAARRRSGLLIDATPVAQPPGGDRPDEH